MEHPRTTSRAAAGSEIADRVELANPLYGEGKTHPLFQPDIILPSQHRDSLRRRTQQDPERKLMLAILEDAVACFRNGINARDHRRRQLFKDSEAWIVEENGDWLFSFEHICDVLGLDAKSIRNELLRWRHETARHGGRARVPPRARTGEPGRNGANQAPAGPRLLQRAAGF